MHIAWVTRPDIRKHVRIWRDWSGDRCLTVLARVPRRGQDLTPYPRKEQRALKRCQLCRGLVLDERFAQVSKHLRGVDMAMVEVGFRMARDMRRFVTAHCTYGGAVRCHAPTPL